MEPLGDSHNFGKHVTALYRADRLMLQKPRTVFWEYFVLDRRSDFRKLLTRLAVRDQINFDQLLGNVRIESDESHGCGYARYVFSDAPHFSAQWFQSFGQLCAFCTILGIADLHAENIVNRRTGFQLIDIECLFLDLSLVSETLLIPKSNALKDKFKFWQALSSQNYQLKAADLSDVLLGAEQIFEFFIANQFAIVGFFNKIQHKLSQIPIRVLIRSTAEYALANTPNDPLSPKLIYEEKLQIDRGDIPYFFTFLGKENSLYYFSAAGTTLKVAQSSQSISHKLNRVAQSASHLLSIERLNRLNKQVLIDLATKIYSSKLTLPFRSNVHIEVDRSSLFLKTPRHALKVLLKDEL